MPDENWKSSGKAVREGLADAADRRIAEAEDQIEVARQAIEAGDAGNAATHLGRAAHASDAADKIVSGGEDAGEAEALAVLRAAYLRGLYTDEPPPAGPPGGQTYTGGDGAQDS